MSTRRKSGVPSTPRVISPSPSLSELDGEYMGPVTRSSTRSRMTSPQLTGGIDEEPDSDDAPDMRRARTRSRSPVKSRQVQRMTPRTTSGSQTATTTSSATTTKTTTSKPLTTLQIDQTNGKTNTAANGHLVPPQPTTPGGWSWRDFSRSPSPLGLIPIHRHWRTFVHKHEVPRKVLHVSIVFIVTWLYVAGTQTSSVPPYLMAALIPIAATDWLRHKNASFNRFYVRCMGALMRESEVSGWNGVVFYLMGAWAVLYFLPKDLGVMAVLLLSWCDTAASTFGRLWGRYTPRIRRGKSLAGSLAAMAVGIVTSYFFYGWLVPTVGPMPGDENFMFTGTLSLPEAVTNIIGLAPGKATVTGPVALAIMSLWSGFVASASEVVDLFGWDDNLTIPILSGIGMWGFLRVFG